MTAYDPDPSTTTRLATGHPWEDGLTELLGNIALATSVDAAVWDAEVVVVCVQTPHEPHLDGTSDTSERAPFDLSYVEACLDEIDDGPPVVLMSTVLPGDCRRLGRPGLIYAPAFPAMGTTVRDVLEPEFLLIGHETAPGEGEYVGSLTSDLWGPLYRHGTRVFHVSWETAELAKMAYNTFIGAKIGLANTVGWLADEVGADGGAVMRILADSTRRIISPAYLQPGLGDGGACHPRDQIALSWLAQQHGVHDLFGDLISQRSAHSKWIAEVAKENADGREIVILGSAYKANSTLTDGSPARLLANQTGWPLLEEPPETPSCVVIGVPHDSYKTLDLSEHIVIDPWGVIPGAVQPGRRPPH